MVVLNAKPVLHVFLLLDERVIPYQKPTMEGKSLVFVAAVASMGWSHSESWLSFFYCHFMWVTQDRCLCIVLDLNCSNCKKLDRVMCLM